MALETGTYINSLVTTNPVAGDPISQGDDHIRLLKATIKSTFPNLTGAVTADQAELNQLAGLTLTAALQERLPEIGTYALLRAYDGPVTAFFVRGVANIFDGGFGVFRVNAADTTTADNGGTVLVDGLGRRWKRVFDGVVRSKWFGTVGDGVADDTAALQAALNYCFAHNLTLSLAVGTHKATEPLVLEYYSGANVRAAVNIIGEGGTTMGILSREPACKIVAYNIPATRCAVELWGQNNGDMISSKIENVLIACDYDSCDSLSFCLGLGDAWFFTLSRMKMKGFNDLLIRNGSKVGATSYGTMTCRAEQVMFETYRYYGFDGAPTGTKATYGFCICPERMFVNNTSQFAYASDAMTFSNCQFYGSVLSFISQAVYENCMWAIPGTSRPTVATSGVSQINRNFYDIGDAGSVLDGGIGLYLMAGNVTLINPYFEDVMKCIYARGQGSNQVISTIVLNPTFISQANVPGAGTAPFTAQYALKSHTNAGVMARLEVSGGRKSVGNAGNFAAFISNDGWRTLQVSDIYNVTSDDITDTRSNVRKVSYQGISNQDQTLTFTGAIGTASAPILTGQNIWTADKDYYVDTITITLGGTVAITTGSHVAFLYDATDPVNLVVKAKFYIDSAGLTPAKEHPSLQKTLGTASGIYELRNWSTTTDVEGSLVARNFVIRKGTPLRCVLSKSGGAGVQDDGKSVSFKVLLKAV